MNAIFHRIDLLPILAVESGYPLPDPKNFASIGWLLVGLWVLIKIADTGLNFYKRHIKQSIPSGDWVTMKQMDDFKAEVHNQLKENRTYVHDSVHDLTNLMNDIRASGDAGREGLHHRLGTVIEVVAELRGEAKGMVMAVKASAEAVSLAAASANRAADRADEAARRHT